jgi:hypothetical protein
LSNEASFGDVTGTGSFPPCPFWFSELWFRLEAFGNDLVWCLSVENVLPPGIAGGAEATKQLLEVVMPNTSLLTRALKRSTMSFVCGVRGFVCR